MEVVSSTAITSSHMSLPDGEVNRHLPRSHTDPIPTFSARKKPDLHLQTSVPAQSSRPNGGLIHLWEAEGSTSSSDSSRVGINSIGDIHSTRGGGSNYALILSHGCNYTSMRDLILPNTPMLSPTPFQSTDDIAITNPLLKHAAYAYLLPKESPRPEPSRCWFLRPRKNNTSGSGGDGLWDGEDAGNRGSSTGCLSMFTWMVEFVQGICCRTERRPVN